MSPSAISGGDIIFPGSPQEIPKSPRVKVHTVCAKAVCTIIHTNPARYDFSARNAQSKSMLARFRIRDSRGRKTPKSYPNDRSHRARKRS